MSNSCKDVDKITLKTSEKDLNCKVVKKIGACDENIKGYPDSQIVRAMCPKSCGIKNNREDVDNPNWTRKVKLNCVTATKEGACNNKVDDYPHPDIVKKFCPVSCKVPIKDLNDDDSPNWKKKASTITLTCKEAKSKGFCNRKYKNYKEVNKKCPKSCDSCYGINCEHPDKHKFCKRWTNNGECKTNPQYMFNKYHGCNCSCSKWCKEQIKNNTVHAEYCKKREEITDDDYSMQS